MSVLVPITAVGTVEGPLTGMSSVRGRVAVVASGGVGYLSGAHWIAAHKDRWGGGGLLARRQWSDRAVGPQALVPGGRPLQHWKGEGNRCSQLVCLSRAQAEGGYTQPTSQDDDRRAIRENAQQGVRVCVAYRQHGFFVLSLLNERRLPRRSYSLFVVAEL